jgi:hypothetical protein
MRNISRRPCVSNTTRTTLISSQEMHMVNITMLHSCFVLTAIIKYPIHLYGNSPTAIHSLPTIKPLTVRQYCKRKVEDHLPAVGIGAVKPCTRTAKAADSFRTILKESEHPSVKSWNDKNAEKSFENPAVPYDPRAVQGEADSSIPRRQYFDALTLRTNSSALPNPAQWSSTYIPLLNYQSQSRSYAQIELLRA